MVVHIHEPDRPCSDPAAHARGAFPVRCRRRVLPVRIVEDHLDLLSVEGTRSRYGHSVIRQYAWTCTCSRCGGQHHRPIRLANGLHCAGIPGLLVAIGMYWYVRDNAKDHPSITPAELANMEADKNASAAAAPQSEAPVTFKSVLTQPVLWQMAAIWFFFDITFWGFSTWLPSYLLSSR